jgi:hypothetical protein
MYTNNSNTTTLTLTLILLTAINTSAADSNTTYLPTRMDLTNLTLYHEAPTHWQDGAAADEEVAAAATADDADDIILTNVFSIEKEQQKSVVLTTSSPHKARGSRDVLFLIFLFGIFIASSQGKKDKTKNCAPKNSHNNKKRKVRTRTTSKQRSSTKKRK